MDAADLRKGRRVGRHHLSGAGTGWTGMSLTDALVPVLSAPEVHFRERGLGRDTRVWAMEWLRDHLWETWLGVAIVLGVAEMLSMDLFLLMLAGGALAGMGTALVTDSAVAQVLVASAASVLLLTAVRPPLAKRLHGGPELVLGPASLVGARALVTESIAAHSPGRVKIGGESWLAVSPGAESDIEVGRTVEVIEIVGATAHVRPVYDSPS